MTAHRSSRAVPPAARPLLWICAAATAGCPGSGQHAEPPPPVAPPPPDAAVAPPQPPAPAPLLIETGGGTAAPWLETVVDVATSRKRPFDQARVIAWGAHTALVAVGDPPERFAVDASQGVLGPLALPAGAAWVGLGGTGDQVLVAMPDGTLLAGGPPATLTAAPPVKVGAVPGATVWAAAPGIVAAAVEGGDAVWVSTDGGRRFRRGAIAPDYRAVALFARRDGVLVALSGDPGDPAAMPVAFLSRRGTSWRRSKLRPWHVTQTGAHITSDGRCPRAVLSDDGVHWVQAGDRAGGRVDDPRLPAAVLDVEDRALVHMPAPLVTAMTPPPPRYRRAVEVTWQGSCGRSPGVPRVRIGSPLRGHDQLRPVRGRDQLPATTVSGLAVLSDGVCAATDVVGFPDAPDLKHCRDGAGFAQLPHLVSWNRADGHPHVLDAPPGCVPDRADELGGLRLLRCAGEQTALWTPSADGRWQSEGTLPAPTASLGFGAIASDGTVVVSSCAEDSSCRAFVRAPRPAGDPAAWREVVGGDVFFPLPGGAVLVVAVTGAASDAAPVPRPDAAIVSVAIERPGQPRSVLASGIRLDTEVESMSIEAGHLVLDLDGRGRMVVADDGSLLAADPPAP